jgi:hypothetical protein
MMGKKKLSEIRAEVVALLNRLPGRSPREWLKKEIESAKRDRNGDVQVLEALCAALEDEAGEGRKPKGRGRISKP